MPNWCMDSVTFFPGETGSLESLKQLQQDFDAALATIKHGDDNWIGRLLIYKGMSVEEASSQENIRCRGFVDYCDSLEDVCDEESFTFATSSAWGPMTEMYNWIAETYQLEYVLCAEEPGCGIYINTDIKGEYYCDRYYISCDQDEEEFEFDYAYCTSLREVIQTLIDNSSLPVTETMTLDELNQLHEDLIIHEFSTSC